MPDLILTSEEDVGGNQQITPKQLRELLPSGAGYVEVKPNGDIALSVPSGSGGGSGSGETYFTEEVTITTLNQFPACFRTPKYSGQDFEIITAWGDVYKVEAGAYSVNPATRAITIAPGAQFPILPGWKFLYRYAVDAAAGIPMLPFPSVADNRFCTANTGTLANTVSYIVRASAEASSQAWQAFDTENPLSTTFWFAGVFAVGNEQWLEIEFSQNVTVGNVDIVPFNNLQPKNFRFQVGNTHSPAGAGNTQVFTRTGETWANTSGETKSYTIPTPQAAKIFRIAISETISNGNAPALYALILKV